MFAICLNSQIKLIALFITGDLYTCLLEIVGRHNQIHVVQSFFYSNKEQQSGFICSQKISCLLTHISLSILFHTVSCVYSQILLIIMVKCKYLALVFK